jgi:putrescine aminotransferase
VSARPHPHSDADAGAVFAALRRHVAPGLALGARLAGQGAIETSAAGAVVTLSDGRETIDFGSYAVTLLGHRHPLVVAAVKRQLDTMPTATRSLANPAVAAFLAALADRCGHPLERVWLGSDGADAVEVATKLARRVSGRPRILAVEGGFHGKTLGALAVTWHAAFRTGMEPYLSPVTHVPPDDAGAVRREAARGDVAALIFEPIQGESGVRPIDHHVLRRWAEDAHAAGAFVISDEVQVGAGRCGPFSLAREVGLDPDAVLFGKALGGGVMPLAAMVATERLQRPLYSDPTWHTSTFGGHPLSCAAGSAALAALDSLADRGELLGRRFGGALAEIAARHPGTVAEVRGRGLLWGIDLVAPGVAGSLLVELAERGLLVSPCLGSPTTIRMMPPLTTTDGQLERALEIVDAALVPAREFAPEPV